MNLKISPSETNSHLKMSKCKPSCIKEDKDNNLTYYEALNEIFNYHCECLQKLYEIDNKNRVGDNT